MANILVIGSGGREHAICWKLSQSDQIGRVFALPGSVGIGTLAKVDNVSNVKLGSADFKVSIIGTKLSSVDFLIRSRPTL